MDEVLKSPRFRASGFDNFLAEQTRPGARFEVRCNIRGRSEFECWKNIFCEVSCCSLNSYKLLTHGEQSRNVFAQKLVCRHQRKSKGVRVTNTGCPFRMKVVIKEVTADKKKKDRLIENYPCFITINGQHNHSTRSTELLKELRVLPDVKSTLMEYLEQGLNPPHAFKLYNMKRAAEGDCLDMFRTDVSPTKRVVYYLWEHCKNRKPKGSSDITMIKALETFASNHSDVSIGIEEGEDYVCLSLVTPFMRRVHQEMKEAGEVVFVDGTYVKKAKTTVYPLLCATPAGAAPLGVVFTSAQDESCLAAGFQLLQKTLGDDCFYGKKRPDIFLTDDSAAERTALAAVWPESKQLPCVFRVLRRVWLWLLDAKNGISENDRQQLMQLTKALMYADSPETFEVTWNMFVGSWLSQSCVPFTRYMEDLVKRRAEWALTFRSGVVSREHNTNRVVEAILCVTKDIVVNRFKVRSAGQLLVVMVELWDAYMRQQLMNAATDRRVRPSTSGETPTSLHQHVQPRDAHGYVFSVRCEEDKTHDVDLTLGWCSCGKNPALALCSHQPESAEASLRSFSESFVATDELRQLVTAVVTGTVPHPDSIADPVCEESPAPQSRVQTRQSRAGADTTEPSAASPEPASGDGQFYDDSTMDISDDFFDMPKTPVAEISSVARPSAALVERLVSMLEEKILTLGDELTEGAIVAMIDRLKQIRSSAELNAALRSFGSVTVKQEPAGES